MSHVAAGCLGHSNLHRDQSVSLADLRGVARRQGISGSQPRARGRQAGRGYWSLVWPLATGNRQTTSVLAVWRPTC